MNSRILSSLLQQDRNLKKQFTLRNEFDISQVPLLVRNKSCECDECGGKNTKQIEEHKGNKIEIQHFMKKHVAQHEKQKIIDTQQLEDFSIQKYQVDIYRNILSYITPRKIVQQSSSCIDPPPVNPTLEQPKRDIQKLNRLMERYETTKIESMQQICKTLPDIATKPPRPQRIMRKQQTSHYSFIKILPLENDDQQSINSNHINNSQQRTPYRNQVYKELNGSSLLQQLQTPIFQKSKFCKNPIIDFADGVKKAMSKIKEMDEMSNNSKMISTQINDEKKSKSRQSLLLKSFLDCTKLLDGNPKSLKQLDIFERPKSITIRKSRYIKNYSPVKVYLPSLTKQ